MNATGILLALGAMFLWGAWSFALNQATNGLPAAVVLGITSGVSVLVAGVYALLTDPTLTATTEGPTVSDVLTPWHWAILAGFLTAFASLLYYAALDATSTTPVTTIGGLYFIVTGLLSLILLAESFDTTDLAAVAAATAAVILFNQ